MEQRYALPSLPFDRQLQATACSIGAQISVRATPYEDTRKSLLLILTPGGEGANASADAALLVDIAFPSSTRRAKLSARCRLNGTDSSPLEKELPSVAMGKEFVLSVRVTERVYEISVDSQFMTAFVHRINPSEVGRLIVDGPVICNEVVVVPPRAGLPPPPDYATVSSLSSATLPPQGLPVPSSSPRVPSPQPVYPAGTLPPKEGKGVPYPIPLSAVASPAQPMGDGEGRGSKYPPPGGMPLPGLAPTTRVATPYANVPPSQSSLLPVPVPPPQEQSLVPVVPLQQAVSMPQPRPPMQGAVSMSQPRPPLQSGPYPGGSPYPPGGAYPPGFNAPQPEMSVVPSAPLSSFPALFRPGQQFANVQNVPGVSYPSGGYSPYGAAFPQPMAYANNYYPSAPYVTPQPVVYGGHNSYYNPYTTHYSGGCSVTRVYRSDSCCSDEC